MEAYYWHSVLITVVVEKLAAAIFSSFLLVKSYCHQSTNTVAMVFVDIWLPSSAVVGVAPLCTTLLAPGHHFDICHADYARVYS